MTVGALRREPLCLHAVPGAGKVPRNADETRQQRKHCLQLAVQPLQHTPFALPLLQCPVHCVHLCPPCVQWLRSAAQR